MAKAHNPSGGLVTPLDFWGLALTSAIVGAGHRSCPNEGNHRGLPLQKMAVLMIKPNFCRGALVRARRAVAAVSG
jgi:hypothetical protein